MNTPVLRYLGLVCLLLGGISAPLSAQEQTPGSTFKRVKVGDAPKGNLINIQIEEVLREQNDKPNETAPTDKAPSETSKAKPAKDLQDWFWTGVSPSLKDADSTRMDAAMAQLADAPSYFRPDIKHMRKLAGLFGRDILVASLGTEVSPAFLLAIISVESAGKIDAVSSAGAQGLMQLIPDTAARFGVTDSNDPVQNITGGAKYIAWLLKNFNNDPLLALAGYNAGENAVTGNDGVPPYAETRAYVPKVVAAWQVARNLCLSPPTYVWEGCVFNVAPIPRPTKTTVNQTVDPKNEQ